MIDTVLFDLDGTLLPMDQDVFLKAYMGALARSLAPHGYEPEKLVSSVWAGTEAMIRNDGTVTNEEAFWRFFRSVYGDRAMDDLPLFEAFYANEFGKVQSACGFHPLAKEVVQTLKAKGCRVALATNPLFPATATEQRIRWAGLEPEDFELITTYENSRHCKPNPNYYRDVLDRLGAKPENTLMVGNDASEDMAAAKVGMQVYLLTDCLINRRNADLTPFPRGTMPDLLQFLKTI